MGSIIENKVPQFGNIGATALQAVNDGVAAMAQLESKILDQSLKLFGGFDKNTFEQVTTETKQNLTSIQNAADYPKPATMLKEFAGNSSQGNGSAFTEVVKNLNDPRFNVSDGLASFSKSGGSVLNGAEQKGIVIVGGKPDGAQVTQKVGPGGAAEKGIIIIGGKPAGVDDAESKGIIVVDGGKPAVTQTAIDQDSFLKLQKMQKTTMQQLKLFQDLKYSHFFSQPKGIDY